MARRLEEFVADLARSRLVTEAEAQQAASQLSQEDRQADDAAVRLARQLIAHQKITPYQARKLLGGYTRGFFLGGYRIDRRLGEGGMGKVYLGSRDTDGRKVAIKVLPPKKALESDQALRRFKREMDLSRRVRHPNLARTDDVGESDGVHFMILEYIPGDSLYNLVKDPKHGPMRVPDVARYFMQVLDGLAAAHNGGLVHRDLKPSNLMVTPQGNAKILDMGLARAMDEQNPLTRPNVVIGTLDYASPEQLSDAASADARSDLYSLGCTIYFALAGHAPFEGGDVVNKIFKQRMEDPEPIEQVARGVPAAFAAIVKKLMAKEPADRYQSAEDLKRDLARWADPSLVKAILGSEAEAAHAFRPPPPDLDDEDLKLLNDSESPSLDILRDLGDAAPGHAPRHRPPPTPRPAIVVPESERPSTHHQQQPTHLPHRPDQEENSAWLVRFVVIVCALGLFAILLIMLMK